MLQTSARLLRLLSLLQARRFWSGAELAERLEVTERTVRRDVDRLRSLGYPVDAASGVAGGYQLGVGASLPPLLLEDDEALAVSIGLRTAAGGTVLGIEEAAVRALAKLERVLPARLRRRVNALHASILPFGPRGPVVDPMLLSSLASACRDHERLEFKYGDRQTNVSERSVEPHALAHTGSRWYLVAFDLNRNAWRTFRVDRISGQVSVGPRFVPRPAPEGGDLSDYVRRSLSVSAYRYRGRIVLHAPMAKMAERIPPYAGVLERLDERRTLFHAGSNSLDSMAIWISVIGVDFEVLEPPELLEHLGLLKSRIQRALTSAGAKSAPPKRQRRSSKA